MLKKHLSSASIFLLCCGLSTVAFAQREISTQNFANTTDGSPVSLVKYENITGNPYLNEEWELGTVKFTNEKTYKDIKLKYDLVADELHFEDKGKELVFVSPVTEFRIDSKNTVKTESSYRKGYAFDPKSFYQVLSSGTTTLLKKVKKIIVDKTPYNSATAVKIFDTQTKYYLLVNDKETPIKNNKKSLLNALGNNVVLAEYIQKEKLDASKDDDLVKIINYYNSL